VLWFTAKRMEGYVIQPFLETVNLVGLTFMKLIGDTYVGGMCLLCLCAVLV
jgi:hypothetical protein